MRMAMASTLALSMVLTATGFADQPVLVLATDSAQKTRVGQLISESASDVVFRDLKDGTEVRTPKTILKKFEKGISDDTAIRAVGLPAIVAWNVAQNATRERPIGKIASVSQNVIYITLGTDKGLAPGQRLDVYRKKNEILDPDTKKVLAVERPRIGIVEITEANKEFSKARLVGTLEIELQAGDEVEPVREKFQVAVLPFRSENGDVLDVATGLAEDLTTQLVRQEITVLERSALDKVLTELVLQNTVLFEPENIQKLGQLAGASAIVTGKIVAKGKLGTAYARLIDVRTGRILYAASAPISLANAKAVGGVGPRQSGTSASAKSEVVSATLGRNRPVPAMWGGAAYAADNEGGIRTLNEGLIISKQGNYLTKDFTFEVILTLKPNDHIAIFGLGEAIPGGPNDPTNSVRLRIHRPGLSNGEVYLAKEQQTVSVFCKAPRPGTHLFRLTKEGPSVTFFVDVDNDGPTPDDGEYNIPDIRSFAPYLHEKNTFLFFGAKGLFKSVSFELGLPSRKTAAVEARPDSREQQPAPETDQRPAPASSAKAGAKNGGYPSIEGKWQEAPGIVFTVTQEGERFTATTSFRHKTGGEIQATVNGTISKEGKVTSTFVHTKAPSDWVKDQQRTMTLSADGKTLRGEATFRGGKSNLVWTRQE